MSNLDERKYVAISIKHSEHDNGKIPVLWGSRRTKDNEERCFSGYTCDIEICELYALGEFQKSYGSNTYGMKTDEPVKMYFDYKKKYKKYDTVLVDEQEFIQYLQFV